MEGSVWDHDPSDPSFIHWFLKKHKIHESRGPGCKDCINQHTSVTRHFTCAQSAKVFNMDITVHTPNMRPLGTPNAVVILFRNDLACGKLEIIKLNGPTIGPYHSYVSLLEGKI